MAAAAAAAAAFAIGDCMGRAEESALPAFDADDKVDADADDDNDDWPRMLSELVVAPVELTAVRST